MGSKMLANVTCKATDQWSIDQMTCDSRETKVMIIGESQSKQIGKSC